jgi:predicted LPLAT superfamily acyltransferase
MPSLQQLLAQLDPGSQLNLMQVTDMSPAMAMVLADKVAQGEFVVIAGDRVPVSPQPRVARASFMGRVAPFPVGPYVLAALLQCPVYLMFSQRTDAGARLAFELSANASSCRAQATHSLPGPAGGRLCRPTGGALPAGAVPMVQFL